MTTRALEILETVDAVFAEDTRVTTELLNAFGIKNKVYSCHKFSEAKATNQVLNYLKEGKNLAMVTDRGTPLISEVIALKDAIDFIEGIGCCYTEVPETDDVDELLKFIKKGKCSAHGQRTPMNLIIKEVIRKKGHRTKPKTE